MFALGEFARLNLPNTLWTMLHFRHFNTNLIKKAVQLWWYCDLYMSCYELIYYEMTLLRNGWQIDHPSSLCLKISRVSDIYYRVSHRFSDSLEFWKVTTNKVFRMNVASHARLNPSLNLAREHESLIGSPKSLSKLSQYSVVFHDHFCLLLIQVQMKPDVLCPVNFFGICAHSHFGHILCSNYG